MSLLSRDVTGPVDDHMDCSLHWFQLHPQYTLHLCWLHPPWPPVGMTSSIYHRLPSASISCCHVGFTHKEQSQFHDSCSHVLCTVLYLVFPWAYVYHGKVHAQAICVAGVHTSATKNNFTYFKYACKVHFPSFLFLFFSKNVLTNGIWPIAFWR